MEPRFASPQPRQAEAPRSCSAKPKENSVGPAQEHSPEIRLQDLQICRAAATHVMRQVSLLFRGLHASCLHGSPVDGEAS